MWQSLTGEPSPFSLETGSLILQAVAEPVVPGQNLLVAFSSHQEPSPQCQLSTYRLTLASLSEEMCYLVFFC